MNWKCHIPHLWESDDERTIWEDIYMVPDDPEWNKGILGMVVDAFGDANNPEHGTDRAEVQQEMLEKLGDNEYWCGESEMYLRCVDFNKTELLEWAKVWIKERTGLTVESLVEVTSEELDLDGTITARAIVEQRSVSVSDEILRFMGAISKEDCDIVRSMIEASIDVNGGQLSTTDCTPLLLAFDQYWEWGIYYLIYSGADVNVRDEDGNTPLHIAADLDMKDILVSIIVHGADLDAKDSDGDTALDVARGANNIECIKILERMAEPWGMRATEKIYDKELERFKRRNT